MKDELIGRLRALVGPSGLVDGDAQRYLTEPRGRYSGATPLILRPRDTAEVAAIVALCAAHRTPIVPQGGNTGLVGGQIPGGSEVLVSLERLDRLRKIDAANDSMIVESGMTLAAAQRSAGSADRLFPLSLAAEGSATIGGAISTNAGGISVLRYGTMRDLVLGLEVVLADGRIWQGLSALRKDTSGYDLKQLFIGAEGTLGIVTAAVLKLMPRPRDSETVLLALDQPGDAIACLARAKFLSGNRVTSFELISRLSLEFVLRHIPQTRDPFSRSHAWYVLMNLDSGEPAGSLRATIERLLSELLESGLIQDAVIAANLAQSREFWRLREAIPEAQKFEGGSIKHDVSIPVSSISDFIASASRAAADLVPGCRVVPFGHVGDGNIHFNVSQPAGADSASFLARWDEMNGVIHKIAVEMGGSFSAEHGVGQMKRAELRRYKDPVAIALMEDVKRALDPHGIMNPGKVL